MDGINAEKVFALGQEIKSKMFNISFVDDEEKSTVQ